jgi:hypothetical protein
MIVLLAGFFAVYALSHRRKSVPGLQTIPKEVAEKIEIISEQDQKKLKTELEALEKAFKSGFISEDSYKRSKKRIEGKLRRG